MCQLPVEHAREVLAVEHFRLVRGEPAGERDDNGWETDLFAGAV